AGGAAEREYKFAITTADAHHSTKGLAYFARVLGEKTGKKLIANVYPGGQLATGERESVDGLQFGTMDVTVVSTGMMSAYDERFGLFSLPFLFRDENNVFKTVDGPIGEAFKKILVDKTNIVILGWFMSGVHTMTSNRPIKAMADLKGLKIRCMENPTIIAAWRAYGATPTPMSIGEVFTALQQGTVDAQDNGTANSFANKYYEVQKYLAMTEHMVVPQILIMAKPQYDNIPPALLPAFLDAAKEAVAFQRAEYTRQNAAAIDNMKARGMEVTYPDKADFVAASEPIRQEYIKKVGGEMAAWVNDIGTKY
ncbi:MAG: TRAP transporter substrate-binding protein, partial [Planctomycetota bacterium]|nr:TRAP transporter substrate-binding protein [Planctomycetota bacterium]